VDIFSFLAAYFVAVLETKKGTFVLRYYNSLAAGYYQDRVIRVEFFAATRYCF